MYTLSDYYTEAGVSEYPEFFKSIELTHPSVEDFRPRWSQITGLNKCFYYPNLRFALYDEQGTGKTLVSQAAAIWHAAEGNRCLCVMPPVLLKQYLESFYETFKGIEEHVSFAIYHGTPKKRDKLLGEWQTNPPDIVLTTYGLFRKEFAAFQNRYQSLIMDEARILGNVENKAYSATSAFLGEPGKKYFMAMNGTPAFTHLEDLYGYIDMVTPGLYPNKLNFDLSHINYKRIPVRTGNPKHPIRETKIIDSYKNLEKLTKNLYKQARRVVKSDVMDIPEKQFIPFPFDLNRNHASRYKKFVEEQVLMLNDGTMVDGRSSAQMRSKAIQGVIDPSIFGLNSDSALLDAIEELVQEAGIYEPGNKVFVMGHHKILIRKLAERFEKYNPAVIYGETRDAGKEADKFKHDDSCRMAIVNYQSGGVGLNFQDVAHTGIAAEPTSSPGAMHQAVDRMHRSGQKNKVNVYMMLPRGTVFRKAFSSLQKNQAWVDQAVSPGDLKSELLGGA